MARKETLELEIKTLIGEAQKNVKAMQEEIKLLAEGAKKAAPETKAIAEALNRSSGKEIKRIAAEMKLFGGSTTQVKKQLSIMKETMIDLVEGGFEPASDEVQKLLKEYKKLEAETTTLAKKTEDPIAAFGGLEQVIMQSASAIAFLKVAGAGLKLAGGALEAADAFESARGELGILLGDMKAGAALFDEMQRFNVKTPFDLDTIKQGTSMLLSAKTSLTDMNTKLTLFGNLSQGNSQKFISFINAFSKASAKGKADMEVLNVYIDQGVQIFDALGEVVGKTAKEIPKMASEGKISFNDLNKALENLTAQGGSYYGAMELGAKSLKGRKDALRESVKGLAASYGQMLMPAVKGVLNLMNKMVNAINESPFLKGVLAATIMAVVTALGILTIKMTASTVATWAAFAARQALNIAMAATNPLIAAGVIGVTAATVAIVAFAAKHQDATSATNATALAQKQMAQDSEVATEALKAQTEAVKDAKKAFEEYKKSLEGESIENISLTLNTLRKSLKDFIDANDNDFFPALQKKVDDLYKKIEIAEAVLGEKKNEKAGAFKENWKKEWDAFNRANSDNPYAQIDFEEKRKLQEAYNAFVKSGNKETIDQIADYYQAKRDKVQADIVMADRQALAKMTKTRVDDLKLRRDKELASFKGTQEVKLKLAEYWEKQITEMQKKEFDERAKAEAEKAKKEISDSSENIAKKTSMNAISNTEVGQMLQGTNPLEVFIKALVEAALSIENVSKLLNPFKTILDGTLKIIEPLVNDALQPVVDILTDIGSLLGKLNASRIAIFALKIRYISTALNILLTPLKMVGKGFEWLYNEVTVPVGDAIIDIFNAIISSLNKIPFVEIKKLEYLNYIGDKAKEISEIMEIRKKEISAMYERQKNRVKEELRAQIDSLKAQYELGLISRKTYQDKAETYYKETDKEILTIEKQMSLVLEKIESNTRAVLSESQKRMSDEFYKAKTKNKDVSKAKEWGEKVPVLGHVAGAAVDAVKHVSHAAVDSIKEVSHFSTSKRWGEKVPVLGHVAGAAVDAAKGVGSFVAKTAKSMWKGFKGLFGFAVGTPELPHDLIAQIHKGEMIVPRTFADGIRSGDLTISGNKKRSTTNNLKKYEKRSTNIYVTLNVEGSVIKKDDLIEEIYTGISEGIHSGNLQGLPESA